MKFLTKTSASDILAEGLRYQFNKPANNRFLCQVLLDEQRNFCAYTEKYISHLDSVEVEHLNAALKFSDDYYNYYAALRSANLIKKDEKYRDASFLMNLFFQNKRHLDSRIQYVVGEYVYEEIGLDDQEAFDFIDFLGLNDSQMFESRRRHITRLRNIFVDAGYSDNAAKIDYFKLHPEELSYVTSIEAEFNLDLSEFYS